ncbi:GntR family transcriptional regulator [Pseudactinotalea sp. Z1748]|uniref:GntR family transcriptional regulator n=1 Tax=Pseudactinotalea sp. Z1748 TaxID=3413027 RepID=UPI003C7A8A2C
MTTKARQSLSVQIYTELRHEIATLQLRPGTMLFENSLAARYETSRTPVRQALTRLEQEELIEVLPQRGAQIAPLSIQRILEAQEIRNSLEVTAIRKAAELWRSSELRFRRYDEQIRENLREQDHASSQGDLASFARLDGEFHAIFMRVAGNLLLLHMVEQARVHLMRMRYLELRTMRHDERAIAQHRRLHQAVRSNDAERAVLILIDHLQLLTAARAELVAAHTELFSA